MCLATHCHEGKVAGTKVITIHAEEVMKREYKKKARNV
jgi:hypothetical protein